MGPVERWFHDIASAMAYSIGHEQWHGGGDLLSPPYNDLANFIIAQARQLPDFLRLPMRVATTGFDLLGFFRTGKLFHSHGPAKRAQLLSQARASSVGLIRDIARYHGSLATMALFSRSEAAPNHLSRHEGTFQPDSPNVLRDVPAQLTCEAVVIGSGPGGSITACLLAEAGLDVLLVEEGPALGLNSCTPFSQAEMLQKYRNGGQTITLGKNKISYVEARCLGGGSEINSGLYHRTPLEILDAWRRTFRVQELQEADLLAHFETCERDLSVSLLPGAPPPASLRLCNGARALGWKSIEVPRWYKHSDPSSLGGTRQSMTETYLPRFLKAGGRILPETRAQRLRVENGKWLLAAKRRGNTSCTISAETVFVCAGAVQTPALLSRSGIRTNIGRGLGLHPTVKVVAEFEEEVNPPGMGVPIHQVKEFSPAFSLGCSISTTAYLALGLLQHPAAIPNVSRQWRRMANYYAMIVPESAGTVRSVPGFDDAAIAFPLTSRDMETLMAGLTRLGEALLAGGACALYPGFAGAPAIRSASELASLPKRIPDGAASLMTIHLFSSCRMGEDKRLCATDSYGAVHGLRNIYINDASLLCSPPGVNPQGTIMALAHRNVRHFLGALGR